MKLFTLFTAVAIAVVVYIYIYICVCVLMKISFHIFCLHNRVGGFLWLLLLIYRCCCSYCCFSLNFPLLKIKPKKKWEKGNEKNCLCIPTTPTRFCAFYAIFRHPSNTNNVEWSIKRTTITTTTMLAIATTNEFKSKILNFI